MGPLCHTRVFADAVFCRRGVLLSAAGVIAAFDAREFLAKLRRKESRGAERMKKGKAEGEEAQTKKACRFGKPLMLFDVSYLVAGVGFEPTTFGL